MTVDLRSDTFTRPTPAMRQAIAEAEVGDDVFGEDPTCNRLQEQVAEMLGKEAGLFVTSGTMGNQVCIKALTSPGDEVIVEKDSHIFHYEAGAPGILSGVQLHTLEGERGFLSADRIEAAIRPPNIHHAPTRLICLENTHNRAGGTIFPLEAIQAIRVLADKYELQMHLDGARLWNASAASGISLRTWARYFDTVTVCFSKGLGAPVGSLVAGSKDRIEKARRIRKILGGGMRQAGILAAGALYAVENHIGRLADDHRRARRLAEALNSMPGLRIDLDAVQTNIVFIEVEREEMTAANAAGILAGRGVLMLALTPKRLRAVTHLEISDADIDRTIEVFRAFFQGS